MTKLGEIKELLQKVHDDEILIDEAVDDLESLFNSNLKEQREGIIELLYSLYHNEDDEEDKAWNGALDLAIFRLEATNTLEVKV